MMEIKSYNSTYTNPFRTTPAQGFTLPIDWLGSFTFQESLGGISTQLTFPRTLPIPILMILDSWPIFPRATWISAFHQPPASKEMCLSRKEAAIALKGMQNINTQQRGDMVVLDQNLLMSPHVILCNISIV